MRKLVPLLALAALASSSCFGSSKVASMRYFWLPLWQGVTKQQEAPLPVVVQVEGLDVDPGYDHLRIVYRQSPVLMKHYRLRQWVTKPGRLLKIALQRYLQRRGIVRVVTAAPQPLPNYVLRGRVLALEQVEEGPKRARWSARVSMRLRLHRASDNKVIWRFAIDRKERVKVRRPPNVVTRMTRIIRQALDARLGSLVSAIRQDRSGR